MGTVNNFLHSLLRFDIAVVVGYNAIIDLLNVIEEI
jgi:hypothetical protein